MENYTPEKVTFQTLLLEKPSQSNDTAYKGCDDTDSICSMGSENRFLKRATLYGRTSLIRSSSLAGNTYAEIKSAKQPKIPKTFRESLYRRKQVLQEPPSQSEKCYSQQDSQKQASDKQASDKQWHVTSWLQKMRPSLYRRKEHATSGDDTARLMATSRSPLTRDYRPLSSYSENENANPEASSLRYHRINAMYWSAKIKDEFTTQLLTSKGAVATDHENR